jgi:hypothetical protein
MQKLKCFRRNEMMQVQNHGFLRSDRPRVPGLVTHHTSLITFPAPVGWEKVFFAKRTQSCSIFTAFFEKTKPNSKPNKAIPKPI